MHFGQPFAILTSILPTDSCYYATGVITDTSDSSYKVGNIFIKFNLVGETELIKKLLSADKSYQTWIGDLLNTSDGNLVDIGITTDTALKAIMLKYNLNGDTIFTKEFFSPYYPMEPFIATVAFANLTENGFYLVCGIDPSIDASEGDIILLKLDSNGNLLQEKIYGNSSTEIGGTILVEEDKGAIIGACRTNRNQVSKNFFSKTYIFKTDSLGNVEWEFLSPPNKIQNIAKGLVKSKDDGLVVATSRGYEHPINSTVGQIWWESAYFFKLDENQQMDWEIEVKDSINPGPALGIERLISVDGGNAYVAAGQYNIIRSLDPLIGGTFGWTFKFSDAGELIWIRKHQIVETLGHRHEVFDLKQTSDGGFIIVGKAQGSINGIEPTSQAWLLKLDSFGCLIPGCQWLDTISTTTAQPENARVELAIYQNPASHYLNFQLRTSRLVKSATFRILDEMGRLVKEFKSDYANDTCILPVSDLEAGVYSLHFFENEEIKAIAQFIVTH